MATRKRKSSGDSNGEDNGDRNGDEGTSGAGKMLDFDDFVEACAAEIGALHPTCWLAACDPDGRSIGSRVGKIDLQPLSTLDDRIEAQWPGPRTLALRTKNAAGHFHISGKFNVPPPKPTPSPSAVSDALLQKLLSDNEEMKKELRELRAAGPSTRVQTTLQEVDGLDRLANVFERMKPKEQPAAAPAAAPPPQKSLIEQLDEAEQVVTRLRGSKTTGEVASSAIEALKLFAPGINKLIDKTGDLVSMKVALGAANALGSKDDDDEDAAAKAKDVTP